MRRKTLLSRKAEAKAQDFARGLPVLSRDFLGPLDLPPGLPALAARARFFLLDGLPCGGFGPRDLRGLPSLVRGLLGSLAPAGLVVFGVTACGFGARGLRSGLPVL